MIFDRTQLQSVIKKSDLYLSVQRFDSAEKILRTALVDFGPLANIFNHLGLVMHQQARFTEAVTEFKKALQVNPTYVEAALNLAVTLCDLSKYDEARKIFDSVLAQSNPVKKQSDLVLGRIANQHFELGKLYMDASMLNDAVREFRKALGIFERMYDVRILLIRCLIMLSQFEKAREELQIITSNRVYGDSAEAHTLLGWVEMKLGRIEAAKTNWVKSQEIDPNDLISRSYLRLLSEHGMFSFASAVETSAHL